MWLQPCGNPERITQHMVKHHKRKILSKWSRVSRRGVSACSTTMELVYKSPKKCTMCKENVDNKARVIEHSHKEHRVKNSVVSMKDVSTSRAVISPIQ